MHVPLVCVPVSAGQRRNDAQGQFNFSEKGDSGLENKRI